MSDAYAFPQFADEEDDTQSELGAGSGDDTMPENAQLTGGLLPPGGQQQQAPLNPAQSPYMALMNMGLGMLAASGQRDARGLPMSGLGAVGVGGMAGMNTLQQQQVLAQRARLMAEQQRLQQARIDLAQRRLAQMQRPATAPAGMPAPIAPAASATQPYQDAPAETDAVAPGGDRPTIDPPRPQAVGGYTPDAIAVAGEQYMQTGRLPPGLYRDKEAREAIMNYGAALAKSRGLNTRDAVEMWRFAPRQAGWIMGADGRAAGSLGTVIDHLDTMRDLTTALQNGDNQTYNLIKNKVAKWTGSKYPTNVEAGAPIVGAEIMKAIGAAGAGTGAERDLAALNIGDLAKSPEQFAGNIDVVQRLAAGQLRTKYRQAQAIGLPQERLEKLVGKRAIEVLGSLEAQPEQQAPSLNIPVLGAPGTAPAAAAPPAPPQGQREVGQIYMTPKGPLRWNSQGWSRP